MGSGSVSHKAYCTHADTKGYEYNAATGYTTGQTFTARHIDPDLDPAKFKIRECCNSEEHPNTIPVILALDVTGSMGEACHEVAAALGKITISLFDKFKDVEFCIMGIGDLAYDRAPIQMSQFESDIRIAESVDKVYVEYGGGGNTFESYTAAWYMGLKHCRLDCWEQGRKGIIITMGDEPLNPYLPKAALNMAINGSEQEEVKTPALYHAACEKYDIFHIAVDSPQDCYRSYAEEINKTFGQLLGPRLKVATIQQLATTIEDCIAESVQGITSEAPSKNLVNEKGEISW